MDPFERIPFPLRPRPADAAAAAHNAEVEARRAAERRLHGLAGEMLAELEATAQWCDERADILGKLTAPSVLRTILNAEVARFRGRAALIRQLILKAKGA